MKVVPAPGASDVDAALGGSLAQTLSALGATGKSEELTKIHTAGRLAATVILAVGLGPEPKVPGQDQAEQQGEELRADRAAPLEIKTMQHRQVDRTRRTEHAPDHQWQANQQHECHRPDRGPPPGCRLALVGMAGP